MCVAVCVCACNRMESEGKKYKAKEKHKQIRKTKFNIIKNATPCSDWQSRRKCPRLWWMDGLAARRVCLVCCPVLSLLSPALPSPVLSCPALLYPAICHWFSYSIPCWFCYCCYCCCRTCQAPHKSLQREANLMRPLIGCLSTLPNEALTDLFSIRNCLNNTQSP